MKKLMRLIGMAIIAIYTLSYSNSVCMSNIFDRIELFSEFYFNQDLRTYFNHKNDDFREAYLMSAETKFEMMIITFSDIVHLGLTYTNNLGMGRQNEAILFDPNEVNYALIPFFEFRGQYAFYQAGLDHRCYHQVDRITRPTAYWNQIYIGAASDNYRIQRMIHSQERRDFSDNLKWSARVGYFIRKMGGMDVTLLSGGHPWGATAGIDAGYMFGRTELWMFSGRKQIDLFIDTTGTPYWAGVLGIDADLDYRRSFGVFINYNYEFPRTLPLFSKDQLFELGIRFRF